MQKLIVSERIDSVDALRGFALAGIVFAHVTEQYIASAPWGGWVEPTQLDLALTWFKQNFIWSKFYSIFSLLFGMSFAIMMGNAAKKGRNFSWRFLWRLALLLGIGIVHSLIYRGDILTIYVVLGFSLPLFYRIPSKWLAVIAGLLFLGAGRYLYFLITGSDSVNLFDKDFETRTAEYGAILMHGSFTDVITYNWHFAQLSKLEFQILTGRCYLTLGYFLCGMLLVRSNILQDLQQHLALLKKVFVCALIVAFIFYFVGNVATALKGSPFGYKSYFEIFLLMPRDIFDISVTLTYSSGFLLLYNRYSKSFIGALVPYGRMALTNYVMQSLIGTFIFYGWGLGYVTQLHKWQTVIIATMILTTQIYVSQVWLRHFHFGPLEWLWRCATWFRFFQIKKTMAINAH
jgi:uncharacterized protein